MQALEQRLQGKIDAAEQRLQGKIDALELRLTIRLGGLIAVGIAILAAVVKL